MGLMQPMRRVRTGSPGARAAARPHANKSAAGYLYAPGTPVAVWN
jgi:hypothetical protein